MEEEKTYGFSGFKHSEIDGSERVFGAPTEIKIPKSYSYRKYLPEVLNQGSYPICVPCSISAYLNWKENLEDGKPVDNGIRYNDIYNSKTTAGEGMTFKEAFKYLRHHGVKSNVDTLFVREYAMVQNFALLKHAIIMNGPCVGALPVYNYTKEFWKKGTGDYLKGYHAISIVGYDEEGFIIRNSWGTEFGDGGYTKINYGDCCNFIEIWTVIY